MTLRARIALIAVCLSATLAWAQEAQRQPNSLPAAEAGRRFGEAAGAALVCYGLRIRTDQVAELRSKYRDAALTEFDEQAAKTIQPWQATKTCENANGPNECKVSQQWSCLQAVQEIGPGGSAVPGLVEPK
ncbi:MAG: hypothetical protein WAM53_06540 [Terrimicrobiaceae bacterium]